jgi:hypothetical protein
VDILFQGLIVVNIIVHKVGTTSAEEQELASETATALDDLEDLEEAIRLADEAFKFFANQRKWRGCETERSYVQCKIEEHRR